MADEEGPGRGATYRAVRLRIDALVRAAGPDGWATPVPACPGWTVHDLVAHLAGIVDDALHDNMAGAPGPAWTAAQVAKRAGVPTLDLLAQWDGDGPAFEALPLPFPPVADIVTHEQDLRGALGVPGERDSLELLSLLGDVAGYAAGHLAERHGVGVRVEAAGVEGVAGEGPAVLSLATTAFELTRAVFGRRSVDQLRALPWAGEVPSHVEAMCVFPPPATDLLE